ncbi:MmpS family transport accessory protein [Mycobacterium sp. 050134]|uniref:MmpS family transport accessory protein n=1 Tax=Mycobacterium sp. 050134 TaxID=3096111 RepID=UPI002EDA3DC9
MGTTLSPPGKSPLGKPRPDDRFRDYPDDYPDDYAGDDAWGTEDTDSLPADDYDWTGWPAEFRWRPIAALLGAVVAIGAIATAVIINSGDSASTKATVVPPMPQTSTSATPSPTATNPPSASAAPAPAAQLPPETVTTVPPRSAPTNTLPPQTLVPTPTAAPAPALPSPTATINPRTVVYTVTGSKQLLDLVNIVYTDARGYPQTEFNVALPWSRMIVLNPGVQTVSVVASSFYGQLNCSVVNAAGQTVVASANNNNLATCTR